MIIYSGVDSKIHKHGVITLIIQSKVNLLVIRETLKAGHSVRVLPGPIPNPEVKPHVAPVLVRCASSREAEVPALKIKLRR